MQRIFAIAGLTIKAAFRFRLFWVLSALLLGAVVGLPILIKDDGTARGFIQIMLTYTLSVITMLLGFATLWLACGILARDIEEGQMQMVAVKPIARWQIWLGKWLGILFINALLLTVAGGSVFFLLQWRARKLPVPEQAVLNNEIFVARGSFKEPITDRSADVEKIYQERLKQNPLSDLDRQLVRRQIEEQVKAVDQVVPPNSIRHWELDLGWRKNTLRGQPLFVRLKFAAAQTNEAGTYFGRLHVGPPDATGYFEDMTLAANTFHEIQVQTNAFDANGKLVIDFWNRDNTALLFTFDEGLEVLYREGGFGLNFARGLAIIFCWLALLAALGLAAASLLSFPVAAFFSLTILMVGLSSGTLTSAIEQGSVFAVNHETGRADSVTWIDAIFMTGFRGALKIINLVQGFSPIDALSTGRSITWLQLGEAVGQIVFLMGGLFAVIGIVIFTRRELATAQGTQ